MTSGDFSISDYAEEAYNGNKISSEEENRHIQNNLYEKQWPARETTTAGFEIIPELKIYRNTLPDSGYSFLDPAKSPWVFSPKTLRSLGNTFKNLVDKAAPKGLKPNWSNSGTEQGPDDETRPDK